MTRYTLHFWRRVRTANWFLGGAGLMFALSYSLTHQLERVSWPGRTISRLAFTPDGKTLVGYGSWIEPGVNQGETRAWDAATGKRLWRKAYAAPEVLPSTFLPDGSSLVGVRVAYGTNDGYSRTDYLPGDTAWMTLRFNDARSGQTSAKITAVARKTPFKPVSIDVAPDGRSVAVAVEDGIALWNLPIKSGVAGSPRWFPVSPDKERYPVAEAKFTRDSHHLVVSRLGRSDAYSQCVKASVEVWDARTGTIVRSLNADVPPALPGIAGRLQTAPRSLLTALSRDRRRISTLAQKQARVRFALWDAETGKLLREQTVKGPFALWQFDRLTFMIRRQGETIAGDPDANSPGYKSDIVEVMYGQGSARSTGGRYFPDRTYWLPGQNRLKLEPPGHTFAWWDDEAVSPNGRLRASPGGAGAEHPVWLYEFGASDPKVRME